MAKYIVNFTDPLSPSIDIPPKRDNGPGRVDSDTSLRLFGEGYTHWGEATNENFVRLLENFMGATPPINPVAGQLWAESSLYHKDGSSFYTYDLDPSSGTYGTWVAISVTSQASPPSEIIGSYWFDTTTDTLNYFSSGYDNHPASWMARSYGEGAGIPASGPNMLVRVFDGGADEWVVVGGALVTDSTSPPAGTRPGVLRFAPATSTLYVWNGTTWTALIDATNPVFAGDIDMDSNKITNLADATSDTDALNRQTGDARYVNASGDTMTGSLTLSGNPTTALHATPKQYVDNTTVLITGSTMTGSLTLSGAPVSNLHAATKLYVDTAINAIPGKQTIAIPASALRPRATNGCAFLATTVGATDQPDVDYLAFDGDATENAKITIPMPSSWDEGPVTASFQWKRASGTSAATVVWGVRAVSISDGDSISSTFTYAIVTDDAKSLATLVSISGETSPLTIAGSPVPNDLVMFEFFRMPTHPDDTMATEDAHLISVRVHYTTSAANDA